jgi:crotonobetainyl-CoA:carnitine CoA-transferase CaiB-like acyl-CoA transferase
MDESTQLPLSDVLVIDLTVARAGPSCVRQLADWGARVIRVEPVDRSGFDSARWHSSDVQNLHRGKRCIAVDLKSGAGQEVIHRLVAESDVVVENMRPLVKGRLGIDYETVAAINPGLVYGSISGFGQEGPYAGRGGLDQIAQGMGGLMSVTGSRGGEPTRAGIPVADLASGLYLAVGIMVALHQRRRTGKGQWVQTSLLESMISMLDFQAVRWTTDRVVPGAEGNDHPTMIPMGCFATSDGHVNIGASSGRLWETFCRTIDEPGWLTDPSYETVEKRSARRRELNLQIAATLGAHPTEYWVELFNAAGVPAGPVYRMDEVFADPQVVHLEMAQEVEHPLLGALTLVRNPVSMSGVDGHLMTRAPEIGEHTLEVLAELGYSSADSQSLVRSGVVAVATPDGAPGARDVRPA